MVSGWVELVTEYGSMGAQFWSSAMVGVAMVDCWRRGEEKNERK